MKAVGGWWIRRNFDMCLTCSYSLTDICFDYCRRQDKELSKFWSCSIEAFFLVMDLVNCSSLIFSDIIVRQCEWTGLLRAQYLNIIKNTVLLFSECDRK